MNSTQWLYPNYTIYFLFWNHIFHSSWNIFGETKVLLILWLTLKKKQSWRKWASNAPSLQQAVKEKAFQTFTSQQQQLNMFSKKSARYIPSWRVSVWAKVCSPPLHWGDSNGDKHVSAPEWGSAVTFYGQQRLHASMQSCRWAGGSCWRLLTG